MNKDYNEFMKRMGSFDMELSDDPSSGYLDEELKHHGIKGQKWGVRRFQNKDGSLTAAGKRRQKASGNEQWSPEAKRANKLRTKKAKELTTEEINFLRSRDATEKQHDNTYGNKLGKAKQTVDLSNNLVNQTKTFTNSLPKKQETFDLSSMSDQELRDRINRTMLEQQYNNVCNPPTVSKGRERLTQTLEIAGSVLALTSSAVGVAVAMKELKG